MTASLALAAVGLAAATVVLAARLTAGRGAWRVTGAAIRRYLLVAKSYRFRLAVIAFNIVAFFAAVILVGRGFVLPAIGQALAEDGRRVLVYVVIGIAAWPTAWAGYRASASTIRQEQELGTLETTASTPAGLDALPFAAFVTDGLAALFWASITLALGFLLVPGVPALQLSGVPVALAAILLAALFLWGIGLVFGALTAYFKELGPATTILQYGLIFLSGVYVPLSFFPPAIEALGRVFPLAVAFGIVRAALFEPLDAASTLAALGFVAIVSLAAALGGAWAFRRGVDAARRAGVLHGY